MRKSLILILICGTVLFVLFQNFSFPARVLPVSKKFESGEVDPAKRIRDFVKFEVGDEVMGKIQKLKSKLKLEWGDRNPASADQDHAKPIDEMSNSVAFDPLQYTFANLRTLRVHDENTEVKCRVEDSGVNVSFEQRLSSTSSYILEHNSDQQKSQAKFQLSW